MGNSALILLSPGFFDTSQAGGGVPVVDISWTVKLLTWNFCTIVAQPEPYHLRYPIIYNIYFQQSALFFSSQHVYCCHFSKFYLQSKRKAWFYLAQSIQFFISKTFDFSFRKKRCSLKIAIPKFQKYKRCNFQFRPKSLGNACEGSPIY